MSRYLVVAHQTVTNPELLEEVRRIRKEDPKAQFVLLVPATPVRHLLRRGDEHNAQTAAEKLVHKAQTMFATHGVELADARVGRESPADAIDDEVTAHPGYAGFVISTLPRETSRWLRLNLPATVQAKYGLPVFHVQGVPDYSVGDLP